MRNTVIEKSRRRLLVLTVSTLLLSVAGGGLFALNQWQSLRQYQQMCNKANKALSQGQYEIAAQTLARCLAYYPDDPKLLADYIKAQNHIQSQTQQNMELTIDVLNRSLLTHPSMHDVAGQLADLYMASGDSLQAIEVANRLLAERPDNAQMLKCRALAYTRLGHLDKAIEDVDRCISLMKLDYDLYLLRIYLMKLTDLPGDQFLAVVESWQASLGDPAWYQALMGVACRMLQLDQQALQWFNEAASKALDQPRLLYLLVEQFDAMAQYQLAEKILDHADLSQSPHLLYQKAWRCWQTHDDDALLMLVHQQLPQVIALQIMAAKRSERMQVATSLLVVLSKQSNDRVAQTWHELMQLLVSDDNATSMQIVDAAQTVRLTSARHELADVVLAMLWETLGEQANALDVWRCVSQKSPNWATPFRQQTRLLLDMGYPLAAASTARKALHCNSSDTRAGILLAESLERVGTSNTHKLAMMMYDQLSADLSIDARLLLAARLLATADATSLIKQHIADHTKLQMQTWLSLAQISIERQADWQEDCLKAYRVSMEPTAQWLFLKAQSMHIAGKTVAGRQLVVTMVNKQTRNHNANAMQWQLTQARFLSMIDDHLAAYLAWEHLLDEYPQSLEVARLILKQHTKTCN